jgi:hypothetical protein
MKSKVWGKEDGFNSRYKVDLVLPKRGSFVIFPIKCSAPAPITVESFTLVKMSLVVASFIFLQAENRKTLRMIIVPSVSTTVLVFTKVEIILCIC